MSHDKEDGFSVLDGSELKLGEELPFISNSVIEIMAKQGIDGDLVCEVARKLAVLPTPVSADDVIDALGERNEKAFKVLMLFTRVKINDVPMLRVGVIGRETYYARVHAFDVNSVLIAFAFDRYLSRYAGWGVDDDNREGL